MSQPSDSFVPDSFQPDSFQADAPTGDAATEKALRGGGHAYVPTKNLAPKTFAEDPEAALRKYLEPDFMRPFNDLGPVRVLRRAMINGGPIGNVARAVEDPLGTLQARIRGIGDAASFGQAPKLVARVNSIVNGTDYEKEKQDLLDKYDADAEKYPWEYYGTGLGVSALAPGGPLAKLLPEIKGRGAVKTVLRLAKASGTGAGQAAVFGAGHSRAPDWSGTLADAARAAPSGAVLGGLFQAVPEGASFFSRPFTPTPAAQSLMDQGADLSLQQALGPHSSLGKLSGASTDLPVIGGRLEDANAVGRRDVYDLALKEATANGAVPQGTNIHEKLANARTTFEPAYEPLKQHDVAYDAVRKLREEGLQFPESGITDQAKERARRELEIALSTLPRSVGQRTGPAIPGPIEWAPNTSGGAQGVLPMKPTTGELFPGPEASWAGEPLRPEVPAGSAPPPSTPATPANTEPAPRLLSQSLANQRGMFTEQPTAQGVSFPPPEGATVGDLITARSHVRDELQKVTSVPQTVETLDRKAALKVAHRALTNAIEDALPSDAARQALRDLDAKYARWYTLARTIAGAGESGEFTGAQFARKVRSKVGDIAFAQGGGGVYRDLANKMEATLPEPPKTGSRVATLTALPAAAGALGMAHNPITAGATVAVPYATLLAGTTRPGKNFLLGKTGAQVRTQAILDALRGKGPRNAAGWFAHALNQSDQEQKE